AVLNVTGVAASASTDVRVYPAAATTVPVVSNLNLGAGQTAADLVVVKLTDGVVRLRNSSGTVGLLADVSGWFGPA
ncbi:MAG: N-acetylmuramoyl-L-alanine amidase, partial [Microbacteriaceae bacterium]|nr:N-acetylmuramoyl-L-alanine amidase [Microbacteriaceae bacterium]